MNDIQRIETAIQKIDNGKNEYDGVTNILVWHSSNHQPTHKIAGVTYNEFDPNETESMVKRFYQKTLCEDCLGQLVYHIDGEYHYEVIAKNLPVALTIIEKEKILLINGAKRVSQKMTDDALELLTTLNRVTFS